MIRIEINQNDLRRFNVGMEKRQDMRKTLIRIMSEITKQANINCPVRTGFLKRSWHNVATTDSSITNVYGADYAVFVELGTYRIRPRRFLERSVMSVEKRIPDIIREGLDL